MAKFRFYFNDGSTEVGSGLTIGEAFANARMNEAHFFNLSLSHEGQEQKYRWSKTKKRWFLIVNKDIENFREVHWEQVSKGQEVWIAGNLEGKRPMRVYGPHYVFDNASKLLKSGSNGKIFREDWSCLYVHKKDKAKG